MATHTYTSDATIVATPVLTQAEWDDLHDALELALDALGDGPQDVNIDYFHNCLMHQRTGLQLAHHKARKLSNGSQVVNRIAKEVSVITGISMRAIMGKSRKPEICRARDLVCYLAHQSGLSYSQIGRVLGRDHTTVMDAAKRALM